MKEKLLERLDYVVELGNNLIRTSKYNDPNNTYYVLSGEFLTEGLLAIEAIKGKNHTMYQDFSRSVKVGSNHISLGMLKGLRNQIDKDWLYSLKDIVKAELFADFGEMATYLLNERYKDAAAVIIGSVLEENLRQLCKKHGIETEITASRGNPVSKKADRMNADLCREEVYNNLTQKNITAWLDLRNKAAHGQYGEYSIEDVRLMHAGIIGFLQQHL